MTSGRGQGGHVRHLTTGVITAVNAGHEYPVLRSGAQPFRMLKDKRGFVVGVSEETKFNEYELRLAPGDRLFLYTDGVPEAQTADQKMFGIGRLVSALNEAPDASPEQLRFAGTFRIKYEKEFHGRLFRDNEVTWVYVYAGPVDVSALKLQPEEVDALLAGA